MDNRNVMERLRDYSIQARQNVSSLLSPSNNISNHSSNVNAANHASSLLFPTDSRLKCEVCESPYLIRVDFVPNWNWRRLLKTKSLLIIIEFILVLAILPAYIAIVIPMGIIRSTGDTGRIIFPLLTLLVIIVCVYTLRKLYLWFLHVNSDIHILPDSSTQTATPNGSANKKARRAERIAGVRAAQQRVAQEEAIRIAIERGENEGGGAGGVESGGQIVAKEEKKEEKKDDELEPPELPPSYRSAMELV